MKIAVIEPHADDAFLSVGWHLERLWADSTKIIVTVYTDKKRSKEAREYSKAVGADWAGVICANGEFMNETKLDGEIGETDIPQLDRLLEELLQQNYRIVAPFGLQHPDHIRTAAVVKRKVANYWSYLDTPYQTKAKLANDLQSIRGASVESICYPPARKWRLINLFKSQSLFFHYNPMQKFKIPEIIVSNRRI